MRHLAAVLLLLTSACVAPSAGKPWELDATAGVNQATNNTNGTSHAQPQGAITVGYHVSPVFEIAAQLASSGVKVDDTVAIPQVGDVDVELKFRDYTLGPVLRINLPTETGVVPFAELGAGFGMVDVDGSIDAGSLGSASDSDNRTEVWYQVGLGSRFYVSEDIALVLIGRYRWQDIEDFDKTVASWQAAAGISFSF